MQDSTLRRTIVGGASSRDVKNMIEGTHAYGNTYPEEEIWDIHGFQRITMIVCLSHEHLQVITTAHTCAFYIQPVDRLEQRSHH